MAMIGNVLIRHDHSFKKYTWKQGFSNQTNWMRYLFLLVYGSFQRASKFQNNFIQKCVAKANKNLKIQDRKQKFTKLLALQLQQLRGQSSKITPGAPTPHLPTGPSLKRWPRDWHLICNQLGHWKRDCSTDQGKFFNINWTALISALETGLPYRPFPNCYQ